MLRVLMYHKVNDVTGNPVTVPAALFEEQMAQIRDLGCHLIQGFLFSRAVPTDDANILVARGLPPEWNL